MIGLNRFSYFLVNPSFRLSFFFCVIIFLRSASSYLICGRRWRIFTIGRRITILLLILDLSIIIVDISD